MLRQYVVARGISVIVGAVWKTRLPRCSEHANVAALHRTLRHGAGQPIQKACRNLTRAASFTRLARLSGEGRMLEKSLHRQTLGISLLLLSGCDVAHNARRDLTRLVHSDPFTASKPAPAARVASAPTKPPVAAAVDPKPEPPKAEPPREASAPASVSLIGKSEGQVRALLGPPTSVEERAPGKTWHYRDGQCSADVQLYPDVQTRQFGTLAYEVKSDDNTDEGRRGCMAQFSSRAQSRGG